MNFKQRCRNIALTWFTDNIEEVKKKIDTFSICYDGLIYYIGNLEFTQDGKQHSHILLCFKNAVSLGSIHQSFPGIHFEPCLDKQAYLDYLSKEGLYATNYVAPSPSSLPLKVDLFSLFMEDLDNGYTKKQLMRKYPSLFIRHFDNISKLINEYFDND